MVTGWLRNAEPFRRTLPCTWTGSGVRAMGIKVRSWIGDDDGIGWSAYPVGGPPCRAASVRGTVARGFGTVGFAWLSVMLTRVPWRKIASNGVVLPLATTPGPSVAYNPVEG